MRITVNGIEYEPVNKEELAKRKPMELWISNKWLSFDRSTRAEIFKERAFGDQTNFIEKLPDSVQVSREQVINSWGNLDSMPTDLNKLLRQLGFEAPND